MTLDSQQNQQASALADSQVLQAFGSAIATVTIVGVGLSLTMTLIALRLAEQGIAPGRSV